MRIFSKNMYPSSDQRIIHQLEKDDAHPSVFSDFVNDPVKFKKFHSYVNPTNYWNHWSYCQSVILQDQPHAEFLAREMIERMGVEYLGTNPTVASVLVPFTKTNEEFERLARFAHFSQVLKNNNLTDLHVMMRLVYEINPEDLFKSLALVRDSGRFPELIEDFKLLRKNMRFEQGEPPYSLVKEHYNALQNSPLDLTKSSIKFYSYEKTFGMLQNQVKTLGEFTNTNDEEKYLELKLKSEMVNRVMDNVYFDTVHAYLIKRIKNERYKNYLNDRIPHGSDH